MILKWGRGHQYNSAMTHHAIYIARQPGYYTNKARFRRNSVRFEIARKKPSIGLRIDFTTMTVGLLRNLYLS